MSTVAAPRPPVQSNPAPSPRKPRTIRPATGVASLTLTISGINYRVRPLYVDPGSDCTHLVRLTKADGTVYFVSEHVDHPRCDCPDFTFSREGLDPAGCKHIKACLLFGLISECGANLG